MMAVCPAAAEMPACAHSRQKLQADRAALLVADNASQ